MKWRERAEQRAAAQKATREARRAHSQKMSLIFGSLIFLALTAASVAIIVTSSVMEARDSIVSAINYSHTVLPRSLDIQYLPINYEEILKIGTSSQSSYLGFIITSCLSVAFLLFSYIPRTRHEKDWLDFWSKLASIVSAICAVIFGVTASLQAWKQIALAQYPNGKTDEIVISIRGPSDVQSASHLMEIGRIGPFPTAKPTASEPVLSPSLVKMVCDSRKKIEEVNAASIIVVGRHDRQHFNNSVQADSNAALAQRRADTVANYLREKACGYGIRRMAVITVIGGPRIDGFPETPVPNDRQVDIFAISSIPPNLKPGEP